MRLCQSCQVSPPVVKILWPGRDPFVLCAACSEKCHRAALELGANAKAISLFQDPLTG